jgi:hypothetical protein
VDAPVDSARNVTWLKLDAVEWFGSAKTLFFRQVTFMQRVFTYGVSRRRNETRPTVTP